MRTEAVTLYFALLAVLAQAGVTAIAVLGVGRRWSDRLAGWWDDLVVVVGPRAVSFALVVAAVCTLGSLYLSEVAHFTPCRLCWYQRAAMYPLVIVLGAALVLRSSVLRRLALAGALIGGSVSVWHILVERYPTLESGACDPANPCSLIWVQHLGYVTIPTMALSGFALIVALLAIARPPTD